MCTLELGSGTGWPMVMVAEEVELPMVMVEEVELPMVLVEEVELPMVMVAEEVVELPVVEVELGSTLVHRVAEVGGGQLCQGRST